MKRMMLFLVSFCLLRTSTSHASPPVDYAAIFRDLITTPPVTVEESTIIALNRAGRLRLVFAPQLTVSGNPDAIATTVVDSTTQPHTIVIYFDGRSLNDSTIAWDAKKCWIIHEGSHVEDLVQGIVPEEVYFSRPPGPQTFSQDSVKFEAESRAYVKQGAWAVRFGVAHQQMLTSVYWQGGEKALRMALADYMQLLKHHPDHRLEIEKMISNPPEWRVQPTK